MLDLATALSTATDPLSVALSFWTCWILEMSLWKPQSAVQNIAAWVDSEDQSSWVCASWVTTFEATPGLAMMCVGPTSARVKLVRALLACR